MKNKLIKLICFTQTSGTLYLTIGEGADATHKQLKMERGLYGNKVVGIATIAEEDKLFIEQTKLFKSTHLQYAPQEELVSDKDNQVQGLPAKSKDPLGLTDYERMLLENAMIIKPNICEIFRENIVTVCKKVLNTDNMEMDPTGTEEQTVPGKRKRSK